MSREVEHWLAARNNDDIQMKSKRIIAIAGTAAIVGGMAKSYSHIWLTTEKACCKLKIQTLAGRRERFWRDAKINRPEAGSTHRQADGRLCVWVEQASGRLRRASRPARARWADVLAKPANSWKPL